jgi:hypothetical protein
MKRRALFPILFFSLLSPSARSVTSLETARTLPDGVFRFNLGAGLSSSSSGTTTTWTEMAEIGFRLGVSERMDFGVNLALPGITFTAPTALADLRYLLVRSNRFALSVAWGFQYTRISLASVDQLSVAAEVNLGYDFGRWVGTYFSLRDTTPLWISSAGSAGSSILLPALGFRFGDQIGLRAEVGYAIPLASSGGGGVVLGGDFFIGTGGRLGSQAETNSRAEDWKERQAEKPARERIALRTRPTRGVSEVLKVRSAENKALISQPENALWRPGERVCLFSRSEPIACGKILKSDSTGAVLSYTDPRGDVTVGMTATAEENPGASRPVPKSKPEPEEDPDLEDPGMGELP